MKRGAFDRAEIKQWKQKSKINRNQASTDFYFWNEFDLFLNWYRC